MRRDFVERLKFHSVDTTSERPPLMPKDGTCSPSINVSLLRRDVIELPVEKT